MREAKPIKVRKGEKVVLLSGGNPQIHEDDLDEAQIARWLKLAAALPGWVP